MSNIDDIPQSTETERRRAFGMVPIFQCLSRDEFQSLMTLVTARTYDADEIIIEDGEVGEDIFVISSGAAAVFKNGARISYVRTGDVMGEMAFITGRPRSATVIMAERGEVLKWPREVYAELVERHPEMWQDLCHLVTARLCETTGIHSAQATTARMAA